MIFLACPDMSIASLQQPRQEWLLSEEAWRRCGNRRKEGSALQSRQADVEARKDHQGRCGSVLHDSRVANDPSHHRSASYAESVSTWRPWTIIRPEGLAEPPCMGKDRAGPVWESEQ